MKIAIIGAGLAGLSLASRLSKSHSVDVFEKARGPGGRMSTRRASPYAFDHGAQYFTAVSDEFRAFLAPMIETGTVAVWPKTIELKAGAKVSDKDKFAAVPSMNAICKWLAEPLNLYSGYKVEHLHRDNDGWTLQAESGARTGPYDWVISTAPAPQTEALFPADFSAFDSLQSVRMQGCFALMLGFEREIELSWTALKSGEPPIGWMAVNSQKPGRDEACSILIQSNNDWAEMHLERDPDQVKETLLHAASELAGLDLSAAPHQVLHRWRYASTSHPAGQPFLKDEALQLAACGDWCLGSKVEAAFLSAHALAESF